MTYRQVIESPFMQHPRLADLMRRASAAQPARAAAAAASAGDLDPVWERAIANAEAPGNRDRVTDAAEAEPAFAYRTPDDVLRRLPPAAAALLRSLDRAATEARDTTVSLSRHIDAASDRVGRASLDVRAAISAARLAEVPDLAAARAMLASDKWPVHYTEPQRDTVRRIVAEGTRLAEAQAEHAELVERRRAHTTRTAPLIALRQRLAEAAGRLRPPIRALELPEIDPKKTERVIAEAREAIAEARAEIERVEHALPNEHEVLILANEAVRRYGEAAGLRGAVSWNGRSIDIVEAVPGLSTEDRRPLRPLALLCAVAPDLAASAIARTIGSAPDAPLMADRPRLLAEARARLRQAEITERAAIAALGDDLSLFRFDCDPAIALAVEGAR